MSEMFAGKGAGKGTRKGVKANHSPSRLVCITNGEEILRIRWNMAEAMVHPVDPTIKHPSGEWRFVPKKFVLEVK